MAKKDKEEFVIRTPHAGFRGERGGLKFFDGVATTTEAEKARELHGLGYAVEPDPTMNKTKDEK